MSHWKASKGRRLVTLDPQRKDAVCELATPTLSALEWAMNRQKLTLAPDEIERMHELIAKPREPSDKLKAAVKRHRR